ncbi:methyl-accepting chemotaxis protein, partial [Poseidonibacter sp.]|uniref:methyl-accepting chemotaxis protein n=1 Tax=Poseidonibacter sp. TaxID=2321188 RepID=UPI003C79566C
MFKNISIKGKLLIVVGITIIGFIVVVLFNQYSNNTLGKLYNAKNLIEELEIKTLDLRKHEKDFLLRKELKYEDEFNKTFIALSENTKEIENFLEEENLNKEMINNFNKAIIDYKKNFHLLVLSQQKIGLNPKEKLYGNLRASVHNVQNYAKKSNNYELLAKVYDLRKQEKDFMLRKDLKYVENFKSKINKLINNENLISSELKSNLNSYNNDFLSFVDEEIKLGLSANLGIKGEMRASVHRTEESISNILTQLSKILEEKTLTLSIQLLLTTISVILLISIMIFMISRNIVNSLNNFQDGLISFFKYLNRETSDVKNLHIDGKDEISQMSLIINDNIQTIKIDFEKDKEIINETISVLAEYEQGDFSLKINKTSSNPLLNDLTSVINKMGTNLEKNIDNILDAFTEFSNSNYKKQVSTDGIKEHLEKLASGVNSLGSSISQLLKNSLEIGLTLDKSSDILIINVDKLNDSSTEAAASLEETAAALEEITSTIVSNSQNVKEMSKYASDLNISAHTGQDLAQNTSKAMEDITEQVTLISDAISIIDQIAFQTNILSLNAAVEAATAGEAGKG